MKYFYFIYVARPEVGSHTFTRNGLIEMIGELDLKMIRDQVIEECKSRCDYIENGIITYLFEVSEETFLRGLY